jgi:thymidylate kinase
MTKIMCVEGVNGSGKSTFAGVLGTVWTEAGGSMWTLLDPAQHTQFGRSVRQAVMDGDRVDAAAEALAFAAARIDGMAGFLATGTVPAAAPTSSGTLSMAPAQAGEQLLVVERWAGAVWAYGRADQCDQAATDLVEALLWRQLQLPTVLVDTAGEAAHNRLSGTTDLNKFETRGVAYLDSVAAYYREWAARRDVAIVDGTDDLDELRYRAVALLDLHPGEL